MEDPEKRPAGWSRGSLADTLVELRARWGWFVALGVIMLVLGTLAMAHVFIATLASVVFIGTLMVLAGLGQLAHAWRIKRMQGFLFWSISGLFYLAAGLFAVFQPVQGATLLTLLFGALLIAVGALRTWLWFNNRGQRGWGWLGVSGVLTLLVGILIAANWPGNSVWILGLMLAIDLLFQGWSSLLLGLVLRQGQR
jgi:uncharacterized membrane protein HdeD (DUF308 family)